MRPLERFDAEAFRTMTNEPAILGAVHFLHHPLTLTDAEHMIVGDEDGRDCFWGVWPREADHLIGTVGTHLRGSDAIEIGYWFSTRVRGRGLASESVRAVISALATGFPDRRLVAECRPENEASWRLLERLGFRSDNRAGLRPGRELFVLPLHSDDAQLDLGQPAEDTA